MRTFYEFFAGGGMAAIGLGPAWRCTFANDIDPLKAASYRLNHPGAPLCEADIASLSADELPGRADLAWASFPCQDLSLAGNGRGLDGSRSGTIWAFHRLIADLAAADRAPRIVVMENVCGLMTSNGGRDLCVLGDAMARAGYQFGFVALDAAHFLPHSRPRLFLIAVRAPIPAHIIPALAAPRTRSEGRAAERLKHHLGSSYLDVRLPPPPARNMELRDIIDWTAPVDAAARTRELLALMAPRHRTAVDAALAQGERTVGALYRRTRTDAEGRRVQRAEVRLDGLAGCLRTPAGGSSRQTLLLIEDRAVRSRLMTARDAAALMGLPATYALPKRYNDAYRLCGDGVAVPVVRFIAETLIEPICDGARPGLAASAA